MINGSRDHQTATTRSAHNFAGNPASLKNPTGQENRRPLLHRIFGNKQQPGSAGTPGATQSSSVGAASRVVSQGFISGGSKQGGGHSANPTHKSDLNQSAAGHPLGYRGDGQGQKSNSLNLKDRHLGYIANTNVVSAAPPSHPPTLAPSLPDKQTATHEGAHGSG